MNKTFGRLTESEVKFIIEENSCPLCGSIGFYHGAVGGGMVNILCDCGAVFNVPNAWEGIPQIQIGEYLRDESPRSQAARDARESFTQAAPKNMVNKLSCMLASIFRKYRKTKR